MSRLVRVLAEQSVVAGCGVTVLVWAPLATLPPRVDGFLAALAGAGVGVALFSALARRAPPRPWACSLRMRPLALATPALLVAAVAEEAIWRYLLLGVIRERIGTTVAIGASTAAFALAHARGGVRPVRVHLVTGACFGIVYVATGRLVAAIATHLAYNLLVVAARASPRDAARPLGAT